MLSDRWILGDPQMAIAMLGELFEGTAVGARARLAPDVGGGANLVGFGEHAEEMVDGYQVVPNVQPTGVGVSGHPRSVRVQAGGDCLFRPVGGYAEGTG